MQLGERVGELKVSNSPEVLIFQALFGLWKEFVKV